MENLTRNTWLLVSVVAAASAALGCARLSGGGASDPKTEEEKVVYTWGYKLGQNTASLSLTQRELDMVKAGLNDAGTKKKSVVDVDKYEPQIRPFITKRAEMRAETEKAKGPAALEAAAKESGAQKLPSGVIYKPEHEGTGAQPTPTDRVKVHYEGRLLDGDVFDSSRKRGEPVVMGLDRVIPCWREGVVKMKVGGKAKLTCPSDQAYGPQGQGPVIPGNAVLTFDVELLDVMKEPAAPPPGMTLPPASGGMPPH